MKRLILILFLIPSLAFGTYTEFYMQSGGSNLNAGSTTSNTAAYTSTNGNWNGSTIFTPTDGSTPANTVSVGDFVSVYLDAASAGVFIARVTAVAAGANGTITVSSTVKYGTAPTSSATGRSIKAGGAWVGPGSAVTFPFALTGNSLGTLTNVAGNHVRINAKNDQTYTMTAALAFDTMAISLLQGYSSSVGDGGKAVFTSNITAASNFSVAGSSNQHFADLIFANTGASASSHVFRVDVSGVMFFRCVFHGGRGSGLNYAGTGTGLTAIECEAYDDNKANTADLAGFSTSASGSLLAIRCYSHDHSSGTNAHGYASGNSGGSLILINSIADTVAGSGASYSVNFGNVISINSNYYNNTGDAIKFSNSTQGGFAYLENNNFLKNGGKAIDVTTATAQGGIIYNNGRGSGTQANGSSDALGSIQDTSTDITYASGVTPWNAPTTGDFSTNLAAAQGAGNGAFTETDGTNTGTVGFPDIGAAQALPGCTFPTPTATATFTPTPTATATASFTPCAPTPGPTATATPTPTPTATSTSTPTPTPSPTAPIEMSYGFQG